MFVAPSVDFYLTKHSAARQGCIVHLVRNAAGNAPTGQKRGAVLGILKAVFAERDPELVRELYQLAIG